MISMPFVICVLGLIFWIVLSAPSPAHWVKAVLAEAAKWCFIVGLFWTVAPYAGKVAF
jgi:hypothetical protein